jgi:hypothetical protein
MLRLLKKKKKSMSCFAFGRMYMYHATFLMIFFIHEIPYRIKINISLSYAYWFLTEENKINTFHIFLAKAPLLIIWENILFDNILQLVSF